MATEVFRRSFSINTSPASVPSASWKLTEALAIDFLIVEVIYELITDFLTKVPVSCISELIVSRTS